MFEGHNGKETLADLFGGKSQLIVYHFMLGPGWDRRLPELFAARRPFRRRGGSISPSATSPSSWSRGAPLSEIEKFKRRMGWRFKWVSSFGGDFNFDYHVSATPEEKAKGVVQYNYAETAFPSEERPGASVFYKTAAGEVFHTYSSYGRGLDILIGAYNFLDLAPKGRDEAGLRFSMAWVRHHDKYEGAAVDADAQYQEPKPAGAASCCD